MLLVLLFFLATWPHGWAQNMPAFFIYQKDGDDAPLQESPNVDLLETSSSGGILIQWSAAFTSYHNAFIKRINYKLQLLCQCTTNTVQQVTFYYQPSGSTEEQSLLVTVGGSTTSSWPTFSQTSAKTNDIYFNSSNGAYLTVSFDLTNVDMSGSFRCELTTSKIKLQSNRLNVVDVREAVLTLSMPFEVGTATLYSSGVGTFMPATSAYMGLMNIITSQMTLNLDWSIGIRDTSGGNAAYSSGTGINQFKQATKMDITDLGQYHITQNGILYVNMDSTIGQNLRNTLWNQLGLIQPKTSKYILLLNDANSIVGQKYLIKPTTQSGASLISLPLIVEPATPNFPKTTFVNNNDHTMRCGFLSATSNLNIDWSKDGNLLSASDMEQRFGIVSRNLNVPNVLDLRGVRVEAKGVWECSLRGTNLKTSYSLNVLRYPSFSPNNSPPTMVYTTEGATLTISCAASSWDVSDTAVTPQIYINNILFDDFCTKTQPSTPSLCEIKSLVTVQSNLPTASSDTKMAKYTISPIPYRSSSTNNFLNHIVSCTAQGNYIKNQQQVSISSTVSSTINIVPKLTTAQFKTINLNQCSQSTVCPITNQPLYFQCELKDTYTTLVKSTGAVIVQYWKLGRYTKDDVMAITDSTSPLKKYTLFSDDGKNLTILQIASMEEINTINKLGNLSCVIEFHYPSYINSADLDNIMVNGSGAVQPDITSSTMGPAFYSSESDFSVQGLTIMLSLGGNPEPAVASATVGIVVGVILAVILILVIIVILYFRFRNPEVDYLMSDKEIAQGRNPIKEFEDNIGFKNYDGDHQNQNQLDRTPTVEKPIKPVVATDVRQMSISGNSIVSGSDEDNNTVDQYGEPDMGRFTEDGSFIASYKVDPRQLPVNLRQLPPQPQAYDNRSFNYGNGETSSMKMKLEMSPSYEGSMV